MERDIVTFLDIVFREVPIWCILRKIVACGLCDLKYLANFCKIDFKTCLKYVKKLQMLGVVELVRGPNYVLYAKVKEEYSWLSEFFSVKKRG